MKEGESLRPCKEFVQKPDLFVAGKSERVMEALILATTIHEGEKRKTPPYEDYVEHCIAVASILENWEVSSEEEIIAALLHDSVENHPDLISLEMIGELFGERVAFLVDGVTKLKSKEGEKTEFETMRKVARESLIDAGVARIKLADRVHNMMTMEGMKVETQIKKARETLKVYAPLALSFGMWDVMNLLQDLSFPYLDPERYKNIRLEVDKDPRVKTDFLNGVEKVIEQSLNEFGLAGQVGHRVGGYFEVAEKIKKRKCGLEKIGEVVSFRVILEDTESCYLAREIVRSRLFGTQVAELSVDHLKEKAVNGYSALEDVYEFSEGRVEICFTTPEKERFNKWGFEDGVSRKVIFTPKEELIYLRPEATGRELAEKLGAVLQEEPVAIKIDGVVCGLETVIPNASLVEVV